MINAIRILAPFLFAIWLSSCTNNNDRSKELNGSWWFCDSELGGYTEISISDSTVRFLSPDLFGFVPAVITEKNNRMIKTDVGFSINLMDENTAVYKTDSSMDTITRIPEDVAIMEDYNCNMTVSGKEFRDILWHEYLVRSILLGQNCPSILLTTFDQKPSSVIDLDSTFFTNNESAFMNIEISFERRNKPTNSPEVFESIAYLNYNQDSSRALIMYSIYGICNDWYNFDGYLDKDGELNIASIKFDSGCQDSCTIDFYILIEGLPGKMIQRIKVNDEEKTIAQESI
jgi:hypothetical protein